MSNGTLLLQILAIVLGSSNVDTTSGLFFPEGFIGGNPSLKRVS